MALAFYPTRCQTPGLRSRRFGFLGADQVCTSDTHAGREAPLRSTSLPPIPIEVGMKDKKMPYLDGVSYENGLGTNKHPGWVRACSLAARPALYLTSSALPFAFCLPVALGTLSLWISLVGDTSSHLGLCAVPSPGASSLRFPCLVTNIQRGHNHAWKAAMLENASYYP